MIAMKKISYRTLATALAATAAMGLSARDAAGIKVYINPGHGGHDADDRNVVIAPYSAGDPNGYWESNSNLTKGLYLKQMLEAKGYTAYISRTTNTSADDLNLSTIVQLSNNSHPDVFVSIHSNATGLATRRNQPLMLFRGYDNQPAKPASKEFATVLNKHLLENQTTVWTGTSINVRGDWSFYPSWGTSGLGVLRGNTATAMLSEGSFHDYIPETYRLMNNEFCWLEAWHFRKAIDEYFGVDGDANGIVCGRINDRRLPQDGSWIMFDDDKFATIQGCKVELVDASGAVIDTYTTETKHVNGFYLFKDVKPGKYTVRTEVETHFPYSQEVEVTADKATYCNIRLDRVRSTPPVVESYSPVWKEGDPDVLCKTPIVFQFNWDMDAETTEKAFSISPAVPGTFTWEDLNYRMVFTPTEPYNTSTLYTVTLNNTAEHAGGMKMEQPLSFKFFTSSQNYMTTLGWFPKEGDKVHYKNGAIEFRFDKLPVVTSIAKQVTCKDSNGNDVAFNTRNIRYSNASSPYGFFRIPFKNDLTIDETYTLTMSGEVADKNGITVEAPVELNFTATNYGEKKAGKTLVDGMDKATNLVYSAENSTEVASNRTAQAAAKDILFDAATSLTYKFNGTEGGEIAWEYATPSDVTINSSDVVGVHVNGDLSGNELYLELTSDVSIRMLPLGKLDFLGWRYIEVPATVAEAPSKLTGVKIVQQASQASASGTVMLDNILKSEDAGVDDITFSSLTVYPNPASEYLIANGDTWIESVQLISLNGTTVAQAAGNVLNVSEVPDGAYLFAVNTASSRAIRKVLVKH